MRKIAIFLIFSCLSVSLIAQDTVHFFTFGGLQNDGCKQVMSVSDGGYIMIGTTNTFGTGNTDFYAIKTDSLCHFEWSKCYGGPVNEEGFSVTPTLDKGFAFVGFTDSYTGNGYDVFLVKTDSLGNMKWQKAYGGKDWDFGYSVKQLKDSGYVICGTTYSYGKGNGDMYIVRTDKMGDTLWTKTVGDTGYEVGNALTVVNDSIYLIAGGTTSTLNADTNACVVKIIDRGTYGYLKSNWIYRSHHNSIFYSIRNVSDKGFVMYGSSDSIPDSIKSSAYTDEYCLKIDSNGVQKWCQLIHFTAACVGKDAVELSDHSILSIASINGGGGGGYDFHDQRFDAGGGWLQASTLGAAKDELAGSIAIGKNGDLIFAGSSDSYPTFSVGLFDVFMVRIKATDTLPLSYDTVVHKFLDTTQWPAAIPNQEHKVGVKVFPNPVVSSFTILIQGEDGGKYTLNLFNINGQCLIQDVPLKSVGHGQAAVVIERNNLAAGTYGYEIISQGKTKVGSGKIIME